MLVAFSVGLRAWGTYVPPHVETAADVAARTGIPEEVVAHKMGLRRKHVAGEDDHCAAMAARAARLALERAGVPPDSIDLILYHGSEYKEHFVWNAATHVQRLIGASNAAAFELYALCAGTPIALKTARALMRDDARLRRVLLVTASRENDLVDYANPRARFMFNFGAGAGALLLEREWRRHTILGSAVISDGTLSEAVIMPAGGSRMPPSQETVARGLHTLDVPDLDFMGRRLGEVSMPNFLRVIQQAVEASGARVQDIDFLALVHMKRSFHEALLDALGLRADQSLYLDEYGHMQSVDQIMALELAHARGVLHEGALVVLAAAGTGYTWSAVAIRW
ncbi:MAG: 3-oxoacyl-ACP synthase [Ardenticatenia bacterium]|nr:MAG: 3-oxoacyl-ACP synthase [Ardenticatenia bacterium]